MSRNQVLVILWIKVGKSRTSFELFLFVKNFQILITMHDQFFAGFIFSDLVGKRFEWTELLCLFRHCAMADFGEKRLAEKVLLEEMQQNYIS